MYRIITFLNTLTIISLLTSCGKSNNSTVPSNIDEPTTTITTPQDDNSITEEEDETANM